MRDTSLASWDALQTELPERRRAVLEAIASEPNGLALFQVADRLRLPMHSCSGRITELARDGFIEDSGERSVNPFTSKAAIVWRVRRRGQMEFFGS